MPESQPNGFSISSGRRTPWQTLTQESMNTYLNFAHPVFFFWQGCAQQAGQQADQERSEQA
jgi:hypothetical protein